MRSKYRPSEPYFYPKLMLGPGQRSKGQGHCFAFKERKLLLLNDNGIFRLPSVQEFMTLGATVIREHYLGDHGDVPCFAMELDKGSRIIGNIRFEDLRVLHLSIGRTMSQLTGRAIHILEWDMRTAFCGCCGTATTPRIYERAKECMKCGSLFFPKISPAIIVLIENGDKALLARSPGFPQGLYGLISGFVEPGESIEEAVVREVMEEVGVSICDIEYFGSQPWPYPDTLMIGFTARYLGGEIRMDPVEIEDAGWYRYNEMPVLPGKNSISADIISYFIEKHTELNGKV